MQFQKLQLYFSFARIERYQKASGNIQTKSIELYKANIQIAQAFHPILGIVEVILRNKTNSILSIYFNDSDWIINQKNGFMVDSTLTYRDSKTGKLITNDYLKKSVEKSENRLKKLKVIVTSGKIIADQDFGFWTDLFELTHYKILRGKPIQIFNHLPTGIGRTDICERLNKVRKFRNRINHNEPICFKDTNISFTNAEDVYNSMTELIKWIDPEILDWIKELDSVQKTINDAQNIALNEH
jgi:hypothetical protein